MGGGGAFRAAAKVAGITVANSGFRSVTAEHPVYTAARNVVRPVSVSAISSSLEDVKSGVVTAVNGGGGGGLSDVSAVQKVVTEFDDWEMAGDEEEMMVSVGEPLPRVVFGGAPSLQEATEATSDLKHALEKVYLSGPANECGGSCVSGSSSSPFSKTCVVSETVVTKSAPKHAMQAFRFLNETPAAQSVVASIACDPNVWNAVMQNPALQEFLESQKTSASFPDSDHKIDESVADTDSFSQSSRRSTSSKSQADESKSGNSFTDFLQNVTRTVTQTVVDMMNSLSDYFNNLFGGNKVFFNADGSAKLGAVETTLGASFMGLAVMVMMVVVSKRGQS
ncbi:putative beta-glucosidase 41-like [Capsicum annuum]|nr:putative beta-glucosidase 41-like [Capsicum annuum]